MSTLTALAASVLFYTALFWPLERAFPARAQKLLRREWQLDAVFFLGQYLVWNTVTLWLLSKAAPWFPSTPLPMVFKAVLAVALGDVCVYWFHRACHTVPILWRIHSVHHSSEQLDWLAAHREHPLDGIMTSFAVNLPALLLGFAPETISVFLVFRGLWAVFIHSNVRLPLGPLRWVLGSPDLHHWHHAHVPATLHNFGNLAPWTDWLFHTHYVPVDERYPLGCDAPPRASYLGMLALLPNPPRSPGRQVRVPL